MPKVAQLQIIPVRSYEAEKLAPKDTSEFPLRRKVFWECLSPINAKFLTPCKTSLCQSALWAGKPCWLSLFTIIISQLVTLIHSLNAVSCAQRFRGSAFTMGRTDPLINYHDHPRLVTSVTTLGLEKYSKKRV